VPRESLDAAEDLPKERRSQVALSHLQDEVPRMPDEAPAGLEQPLPQTRQRPTLIGEGQSKWAQEVAEIADDEPEKQPHLVGPKKMAGCQQASAALHGTFEAMNLSFSYGFPAAC
jgi:hypothetical protein